MVLNEATLSVLCVSSTPAVVDLVTSIECTDSPFAVELAPTAEGGLDFLGENRVDCIVSDSELPVIDGIEFVELVRAEYPALPFVLVTGQGSDDGASRAISAGVTDCVRLDDDVVVLGNRIENAVSASRDEQQDGTGPTQQDESETRSGAVTDQCQTIEQLRDREQLFRQMLDHIYEVVWITNAETTDTLYVNPAYEDVWGRPREHLFVEPKSFSDAIHPDDRQRVLTKLENVPTDEYDLEYRITHPEDGLRWIHDRGVPIHDDAGDVSQIVGIAEDITEKKRDEETLRRQRDELERLNRVNAVIRAVDRTIVNAQTRDEIDRGVCEQFATSGPYDCAVIGELSPSSDRFTPRVISSNGGDFDETIHSSPDESVSDSPEARAVTTRDVQVVKQLTDVPHRSLERLITFHECDSYVAIPIFHGDIVYGVLDVFTTDHIAFDDDELAALNELGETIGHAINALDRKRMLIADEVVEIDYRSDQFVELFTDVTAADAQVSVDQVIPLPDNNYLQYLTVERVDPQIVIEMLENVPQITNTRLLNTTDETGTIELHLVGETIPSLISEYGGQVSEMSLTEEELHIVAELPLGVSIREITAQLQTIDPSLSVAAQRTVSRHRSTPTALQTLMTETLTERQQTVLTLAYYSGYFEWPRETSGEDLAMQLDVASSTFYYHVRHGVSTVLELFLETPPRE